ncbi:LLM class flavin-dependent oxidoreductase [Paraburkholderia silvatlantica]|uniref:FMN-dependent oxidoreductase (Nitrilotriacetate monooxygenase family) n=1 Tax=Paraburkholderia silvatlantica TaxID=321895 RepID=A0ABR6FGT0_9BURK|nr:LLM class flavin-dependent oxidoreductase [Paraburkholderia silvatlantica]MBB2926631.1 FMN-dependent oxidoreductase (nitrilotriacetate monooxygenase family) [Paraburkholderia silvatlantica]PVY37735.1 FMN-dependent oxidoreductase (nitrilotriacetate monooxygenase family) [Paraburkholderia silvatlantica]PXW42698.1 FMN-dependent oxidoreductase (nitrilotriacetate monooxygenase family) [Paraburkholderia silvatlantica]
MSAARTLHLNTNVTGTGRHPAGWRTLDNPKSIIDLAFFTKIAQTAERGKLDAVFLSDALALRGHAHGPAQSLEPTVLLTALAAVTRHVGLIGTASTTFNDPYNLARRFASVDHLSAGRVAWNAVTTYDTDAAGNFGGGAALDKTARYERAAEFVDVVQKLWDSWEDDALIADRTSGRYADPTRVHAIAHDGPHFQVRGPLNLPRSPQGRPVLVQAGGSEAGVALAARHADAVFTAQTTFDGAQAFYRDIKARAVGHGRNPDHFLILPGLYPVIGGTLGEARQRKAEMDALLDRSAELAKFAGALGVTSDALQLDAPLPYDLLDSGTRSDVSSGFIRSTVLLARSENLTVRELLDRNPGAHRMLVGTPETIADDIERWFAGRAADGFNLNADVFPSGLAAFVDHVVPLLQRKGIFRREYEGTTLREHYGLPRPTSRYAGRADVTDTATSGALASHVAI